MSRARWTLAALALAGCEEADDFDVSSQIGPNPVLPEPQHPLLVGMKIAEVVGWDDGEAPEVAPGLTVTAYATDLANPRTVHTLPNGDVLVVQSVAPPGKPKNTPKDYIRGWIMAWAKGDAGGGESNLITLLRDPDRDGTVDERLDLLTGLQSPFGLVWVDETLYVAMADAVVAYPYSLGDDEVGGPGTVVAPLPGGPINHHWTKDLALGPDGYLYASVGSNSNAAERGIEAEKGRAAIWRIDRETGEARLFATGLRNPNGLTFHPDTGALWTVVNERDELGPNLVPDYLTSVQDGGFYGWPWSYYGDHVDRRVKPERPDLVEQAIVPDYALSSHVAALGLTFTMGSALPADYASGAMIGQHGSWNRDAFNGYNVVYVPFENGMPSGMPQEIVGGFLDGDTARGRPVGVTIDGTGALLVADDAGGVVWRVAAADGSVTPAPPDAAALEAAPAPEAAPPAAPALTAPGIDAQQDALQPPPAPQAAQPVEPETPGLTPPGIDAPQQDALQPPPAPEAAQPVEPETPGLTPPGIDAPQQDALQPPPPPAPATEP